MTYACHLFTSVVEAPDWKNSVDFFFGSSLSALLVAFSHGFGSSPEQGEILAFAKGYTGTSLVLEESTFPKTNKS